MDNLDNNNKPSAKSDTESASEISAARPVSIPIGTRLLTLTQGTALQGYAAWLVLPMALCNYQTQKTLKMVCLVKNHWYLLFYFDKHIYSRSCQMTMYDCVFSIQKHQFS